MVKTFLRRKFFVAALALLAGLYLFSLYQRDADIDDAWIGEHAYWLATEGHARSELMRGITGQEDYLLVHHKLLTLHGALFIKLFGFSLPVLKSVSLVYFLVFLALFFHYCRQKIPGRDQVLLCAILILAFPWTFKYSFVYRPEIMIMTLTFAGWILLESIATGKRKEILRSILAGLLAGLCFAAHLNGIIVAAAGFLFLLIYRKYRASLLFAAGSLAGALVYFYDFNATYGWQYWWYQLTESPALDSLPDIHPLLQPFVNLLNEHQRFFHNPKIAAFSILVIFALVTGFKRLTERRKAMLWYTLLLALLLGLTAMHKSRQYLLVYFPFLVIMVSDVYASYFTREERGRYFNRWRAKKATGIILLTVFLLFLLSATAYNLVYSTRKFSAEENSALTRRFVGEDPAKVNIVAPMTLIFNEIEDFNRIQSEVCYTELQKSDPSIYGAGLLERTKPFDIRYIILSEDYRKLLGWEHPDRVAVPEDFEVISDENDDYLVIRRR